MVGKWSDESPLMTPVFTDVSKAKVCFNIFSIKLTVVDNILVGNKKLKRFFFFQNLQNSVPFNFKILKNSKFSSQSYSVLFLLLLLLLLLLFSIRNLFEISKNIGEELLLFQK